MRGRVIFGALALAVGLLAAPAGAQSYCIVIPLPPQGPLPAPPEWWGTPVNPQPITCGYARCCPGPAGSVYFAYPSGPSYNAMAFGPLNEYPTYGPPPEGHSPATGPLAPPAQRKAQPFLFGKWDGVVPYSRKKTIEPVEE